MRLLFTKEIQWLKQWDEFLVSNPKGSHLVLSDWLKSFKSYGFDYEIGLFLEDDKIIGGFGAVIPKFMFFKFYIIPHGLIYKPGYEDNFKNHITEIIQHAKKNGSCYFQLSVPKSSNEKISEQTYRPENVEFLNSILKPGKHFKYVYSSYGINWVDFNTFQDSEAFLAQLTPKVRRNIRMPYNKGAKVTFATDIKLIEEGYKVIAENAKQANYSVRDFSEFKTTIFDLINKDLAYFVICKVDNVIKAAGIYVKSSGYLISVSAGVIRHKPDIKLGYMLQWEMIKKSFENAYKGYNISMGGSTGVQDFKSKFGTETIYFEKPHYHLIFNGVYFKLFLFLDKYLKPYKAKISKILAKIK
jgi:lipid II:glycine glycyltransferase (peptidoglycan interpeptide bridge formation enzyme)